MPRWLRWPTTSPRPGGLVPMAFGADYNPEQWSPEIWREDVALMREAHVNVVNLGIFSWAQVRPSVDEWCWGWLDEAMDLLYDNGIAVDLATGTASPPPWLTAQHPEILPVTANGDVLSPGGRQHWRPTSPVFREYALDHARAVADRYGAHPGLAMWHVSNELGCHNVHDYSDDAAVAFRRWLTDRYGDLDTLNSAWGTAFWSQRYSDWEQVLPPRLAATYPNPTQQLDFARFSSWALQDYLRCEVALLRERTPQVPVTTNFMVMNGTKGMDYAAWATDIDLVSNDHYLQVARPDASVELCFSANLTSGIAAGRPWFLMEHSTGAVNWQQINTPKLPGQMRRDSLAHVAHGSDAVSFFQWRQSRAGAEKYHSAMVSHAGSTSRLWRDVVALGHDLTALAEVRGAVAVPSQVAVLFDWPSWWSSELDSHPSSLFQYRETVLEWYTALHALGIGVDVVPASADLRGYPLVIAPALYLVDAPTQARLQDHVASGNHLVVTYFSGIVDENDHIYLGGYPGALRELLGVQVEELAPLLSGRSVPLQEGGTAVLWAEQVDVTAAETEALLTYAEGQRSGTAAATLRRVGKGSAAYVGAGLDAGTLRSLVHQLAANAGVRAELPAELEGSVTRRVRAGDDHRYTFLINHKQTCVTVPVGAGVDLLTGAVVSGTVDLPGLGVAVIRH